MISLINPTGKAIRSDSEGDGHYGARRGAVRHKGIDLLCVPGQDVLSPVAGFMLRVAFPYADDLSWTGIVIQGDWCRLKMFYLEPYINITGAKVSAGQPVGKAQDISRRYSDKMQPHIHLEFEEISQDPAMFL
jgi:hypothetical protein